MAHLLARLKFYRGSGGNEHGIGWLLWVAGNPWIPDNHVEHSEVSQFHLVATGQSFRNIVKSFIDHFANERPPHPGFSADALNQFELG